MKNYNSGVIILKRLTADFIFVVHFILVSIVAIGWLVPQLFYVHLSLLLVTMASEIALGYCLLTRMEFDIRRKLDPTLLFDKSCISHYTRKWRGLGPRPLLKLRQSFLKRNSFMFILLSLGIISFVYRLYF
jgi:hypothetical protein